ncbi:MAG TPA: kinase/pyrophosphorylase [Chloroflexi bacterium]|nr:kinase/pyrophosphorylase [Chloroflexota bacterium]
MVEFSEDRHGKAIRKGPPIFVVSGGVGATGDLLARTVLAQFPDVDVPINVEAKVVSEARVQEVIRKATGIPGAIILHTMVKRDLRRLLVVEAARAGIVTFDLAGPLEEHLSRELGMQPLQQPGLYHQMRRAYFDRVEAIEFTVAHDDGKRVEDLPKAEIVLLGPSRVGKTPLSMYLSILGWKTANVPFVPGVPPPPELQLVAPHKVVGLIIEPAQMIAHRRYRASRAGIPEEGYVDRQSVIEEMRAANHFFYRQGYHVVDTTDKPIETSAEEIISLITRRKVAT